MQGLHNLYNDKTGIRALEDRVVAAFNAGDVEAIMKNYIADESFIIFDVVPRESNIVELTHIANFGKRCSLTLRRHQKFP